MLLFGFLGEGAEDGRLRLYLSPQLTEFVEFAENDLSHRALLPEGSAPLQMSAVWIRRSARVRVTQTISRTMRAELLRGAIEGREAQGSPDPAVGRTARPERDPRDEPPPEL